MNNTESRRAFQNSIIYQLSLVAMGAVILEFAIFPIQPTDLFLYLAIARETFRSGHFPVIEPFLFSLHDYHWQIWHEWLTFFIYYGVFKLGGWALLTLFKAAACLFAYCLPALRAARKNYASVAVPVVTVLAAYAAAARFAERGSLFTDVLTPLVLFIVLRERESSTKMRFALPVIFIFWVNLHGGFVMGYAVFALALMFDYPRRQTKTYSNLFRVFMISVAAGLANPRGIFGLFYPFQFFSRNQVTQFQMEFASTFNDVYMAHAESFAYFALVLIGLVFTAMAWRRFKLEAALVVIFSALGLWLNRNVSTASPVLAILIIELASEKKWLAMGGFRTKKHSDQKAKAPAASEISPKSTQPPSESDQGLTALAVAVTCALTFLTILIGTNGYQTVAGDRFLGLGIDFRLYPLDSLKYLSSLNLTGRLYNSYGLGSYLAWVEDGRRTVFYHSGVEDLGLFADSKLIAHSKEDFNRITAKYGFTAFMITKHGDEDDLISLINTMPGWSKTFEDPAVLIYLKSPQ